MSHLGGCDWHPAGRSQGRCSTPCNPRGPRVNRAGRRNPRPESPALRNDSPLLTPVGSLPPSSATCPDGRAPSHLHVAPDAPSSSLDTRSWGLRRPLPSRPQIASLIIQLMTVSPCCTPTGPGAVPGATRGPREATSRVCGPPKPSLACLVRPPRTETSDLLFWWDRKAARPLSRALRQAQLER